MAALKIRGRKAILNFPENDYMSDPFMLVSPSADTSALISSCEVAFSFGSCFTNGTRHQRVSREKFGDVASKGPGCFKFETLLINIL